MSIFCFRKNSRDREIISRSSWDYYRYFRTLRKITSRKQENVRGIGLTWLICFILKTEIAVFAFRPLVKKRPAESGRKGRKGKKRKKEKKRKEKRDKRGRKGERKGGRNQGVYSSTTGV